MKKPLFRQLFSVALIIILLLSGTILFFTYRTVKREHIEGLSYELLLDSRLIRDRVSASLAEGNLPDTVLYNASESIDRRITVIDSRGRVLFDSEEDEETMDNHADRPEFIRAMARGSGYAVRYSNTLKKEMIYSALKYGAGENSGVIRVSVALTRIDNLFNKLFREITIITVILTGLALVIILVFTRSFIKPVNELLSFSHRISEGDFNARLFLKGGGEFKKLADSFNYAAERVNALFDETSSQKETLSKIMSTISEAVVLIDSEERVVFNNELFESIFGNTQKGVKYWEIIRSNDIIAVIRKAAENKSTAETQTEVNSRFYQATASYLPYSEEILLTLYDTSRQKNLEIIKKEFISNMSHELRTPLTAIKGFLETIEPDQNDANREFVHIMENHTSRLIRIVEDISVLADLEDYSSELSHEKINLVKFLENEMPLFKKLAEAKGLDISLNTDEMNELYIEADPFKLEQVFINIVDNAVKYTEEGSVNISIDKDDEFASVSIKDTGIGISEEDISRIFERFYVADKSRSRKAGGTGLGLSIVKHIVNMHDGEIDVESYPGEGTSVTVKLRRYH
ncbi:MAG: ATP-binding protein [candidate division WOR-3 bacterium]|nr:ATP-binding protein [candidate division WOR-3 bacterium]